MSGFADQGPMAARLPDGRRLHLQHGPIDLIVEADGQFEEVEMAYQQASDAFRTVLVDLVDELQLLRTRPSLNSPKPSGAVAQRMWRAVAGFSETHFITPMAAVAGSVADHVLAAMVENRRLSRAYVNNGGDISLFMGPDSRFDIGVCSDPRTGVQASTVRIHSMDGIGGVATSGWRGRSHSLGIADAVTVLARNAAVADAAATLIANAVDLPGSALIKRSPASELSPDSDLGDRLVTTEVGALAPDQIDLALARGTIVANEMRDREQITSAFLTLQGGMCAVPESKFTNQTPALKPHASFPERADA